MLLAPDVVEKILDAYWRRNGDEPKTFTIDLAKRLLMIAKETKCIAPSGCDRLDEMRASLETHRRDGLTDKNIALIRKVITPGVWSRVVQLPFAMMALRPCSPSALTYASCCHGPACGSNCHPHRGASALGQSDDNQAWRTT